mmetsp:Transcript_2755/g.7172  ORF Transcript_2755/g.7172 Transcript_2755/m.7172 type:complete len:201 (-) Transcript_2755:256-858(-)
MEAHEAAIESLEEVAPHRRHRWGRHGVDHGTRRRGGAGTDGSVAAGRQVDQSLPDHDLLLRGPRRARPRRRRPLHRAARAHRRPRARRSRLVHLDDARDHLFRRARRHWSRAVCATHGFPGPLGAAGAELSRRLLHHRGRLEAAGRPGRAGGGHVRRGPRRVRRSGPDRAVRSHPNEGPPQRAAGQLLGLGTARVFGRGR